MELSPIVLAPKLILFYFFTIFRIMFFVNDGQYPACFAFVKWEKIHDAVQLICAFSESGEVP